MARKKSSAKKPTVMKVKSIHKNRKITQVSMKEPLLENEVEMTNKKKTKIRTKPHDVRIAENNEMQTDSILPQKRAASSTQESNKFARTSIRLSENYTQNTLNQNFLEHTDNLSKLSGQISEMQEQFKTIKEQMKTHTEAIQGLMQVVSSPQNLTNFQHQYAFQQNQSSASTVQAQQPPAAPVQSPVAAQSYPAVRYVPMYGYPRPMYYQSQAQVQQTPNAQNETEKPFNEVNELKDPALKKFEDIEVQSAAVAKALLLAHGKGESDSSDTEESSK